MYDTRTSTVRYCDECAGTSTGLNPQWSKFPPTQQTSLSLQAYPFLPLLYPIILPPFPLPSLHLPPLPTLQSNPPHTPPSTGNHCPHTTLYPPHSIDTASAPKKDPFFLIPIYYPPPPPHLPPPSYKAPSTHSYRAPTTKLLSRVRRTYDLAKQLQAFSPHFPIRHRPIAAQMRKFPHVKFLIIPPF
ncbi:hypothetical protein HOY80DRAFT_708472 [Tuber brumale]|nr:hypothetical protein HOY80DRAFT_708472 [Tuber brumale]